MGESGFLLGFPEGVVEVVAVYSCVLASGPLRSSSSERQSLPASQYAFPFLPFLPPRPVFLNSESISKARSHTLRKCVPAMVIFPHGTIFLEARGCMSIHEQLSRASERERFGISVPPSVCQRTTLPHIINLSVSWWQM